MVEPWKAEGNHSLCRNWKTLLQMIYTHLFLDLTVLSLIKCNHPDISSKAWGCALQENSAITFQLYD